MTCCGAADHTVDSHASGKTITQQHQNHFFFFGKSGFQGVEWWIVTTSWWCDRRPKLLAGSLCRYHVMCVNNFQWVSTGSKHQGITSAHGQASHYQLPLPPLQTRQQLPRHQSLGACVRAAMEGSGQGLVGSMVSASGRQLFLSGMSPVSGH